MRFLPLFRSRVTLFLLQPSSGAKMQIVPPNRRVDGMSSQTPTTGDRSRTYWTAPMERYFIDLMLDQRHRGNKIGHTFNKQAWTDMLTWFNAKFGSQYDKDVLKSRYTNLWKQFNDVKMLLEQNGFVWDETRQMVTADEYVWNAYIKAHPDARSYKTKKLLNYDDLCVIFGYATADGRYSRSSHDVDNDDDLLGIKIVEGTQAFASSERSRTEWTPPMDRYFIDLMLDQLQRGNKIDHTFNKQAWTDMVILFNEKFNSQYGKRVLRHRYKKLCKYCNDITVLLDQNTFYWDEIQHRVTAEDDVWDAYIKAHPYARSYRARIFPNYKDLCLIYGNGIAGERCSLLDQEKVEDDSIGVKTGDEREREDEVPSSTDRSRTYWTPPMDRYFIELLLEQVNAGNKIGHTFITQAWVDMVTSFNAKFGSHHDKDVLKNRYKHLRRQHNDITVLLDQSRFSWDQTRQMVTADDHVWDAYIKEHPDARSYRIKTVPNYNNLCLIYGKETNDGRYSRLARDTDVDNGFSGLEIGNGTDSQATISGDRSRTDWTPSMDRYFIDLMLEQVQKGNKFDNTFNKQAWTDMITLFNVKFGSQHDKDVLRSRYKNLRKQYNDMKLLLQQNGFTWDETRQMVTANDDVWDAYIKEHPDARSYRTKTKSNYVDLCVIYGNSNAVGHKFTGKDIYVNDDILRIQTGEGKDGEAPPSTDRSRTDWTPPMDHYFINLMLDQVHQGNMIDHKFRKQAWTDMITLFNAKFGSQHDKDVLKSRYKNLRKRYNDMKMLLDQGGFTWDEARHIIIADDDAWDAYIKKHPDARSYRTKTMPNYKDLCLIYGNVIVEQRESPSEHAIGFVDDFLGVLIEGNDDKAISNSDCLSTDWTPPMYHYFIDLMLEQVQRGNKIDHTFNEQAWMHMITKFNEKFSSQYGNDAFESQYENLGKQYNNVIVLLGQGGFAWDDAQKMITADHWDAFIEAHPDALSYRTRVLENFNNLSVIYGNGTADGGGDNSRQHVDINRHKREMENGGGSQELQLSVISVSPRDPVNDVQESSPSGRQMDMSDQQNKRRSVIPSSPPSCRKVQRTGEGMTDALSEMADVVTSLKNEKENKNFVSIENVITELQALADIDDELLLDACDLLEDEKKAKTFLALDVSLRKKWLLRKLRP